MPVEAEVFQNVTEEGRMMYSFTIVGYRNEYEYD